MNNFNNNEHVADSQDFISELFDVVAKNWRFPDTFDALDKVEQSEKSKKIKVSDIPSEWKNDYENSKLMLKKDFNDYINVVVSQSTSESMKTYYINSAIHLFDEDYREKNSVTYEILHNWISINRNVNVQKFFDDVKSWRFDVKNLKNMKIVWSDQASIEDDDSWRRYNPLIKSISF